MFKEILQTCTIRNICKPVRRICMLVLGLKLINNRWAWGRCLREWWSPKQLSRAPWVTMTTLWVATTRHRHTENSGTTIFTTYLPYQEKKGWKGQGVKAQRTVDKWRAREMNWPQRPNCKTQKAPATTPPATPQAHHVGDRWPAFYQV